jgi:hypothetical protein
MNGFSKENTSKIKNELSHESQTLPKNGLTRAAHSQIKQFALPIQPSVLPLHQQGYCTRESGNPQNKKRVGNQIQAENLKGLHCKNTQTYVFIRVTLNTQSTKISIG